MNTYIHVLEGRLRIKVPEVKRSPLKASEVVSALQRVEGITYVHANPTTGSVLVLFAPDLMTPEQIIRALQGMGCLTDPYISFLQHTSPSAAAQKMVERLLQSVFEAAVQRAILALI